MKVKTISANGQNDSGRFLKLFPVYTRMTVGEARARYLNLMEYDELPDNDVYWVEDTLTHHHLVAAINGLFTRADLAAFAGDAARRESRVIETLSQGVRIASTHAEGETTTAQNRSVGNISDWQRCENLLYESTPPPVVTRFSAEGSGLRDGLETISYPDFGLYLFRSRWLYLAIRCGTIGQNGNGGHAHNDQLSIEVEIKGKTVIMDPGTYLYTASPEKRNAYRSVGAHFAPRIRDKEPGDLSTGTFVLGGDPNAQVIYFGVNGFVGRHDGYGNPAYRQITVEDAAVVITDFSPGNELTQYAYGKMLFSPAYGVIQNEVGSSDEEID
jgi:hypothetical protein